MDQFTHKVVLVEDNPADARLTRDVLQHYFTAREFEVLHFTNISDARSYIDRHKQDISLILLDLGLPDARSPHEAYGAMRSYASDIPIVVLTGSKDQDIGLMFVRDGAEDFVNKDVLMLTPDILKRSIDFAIGRHRALTDMHSRMVESEQKKEMLMAWMGGSSYSA